MGGTLNAFSKKRLVITNLSYFVMMHKKALRREQGSTRGIYSFPRELFFPNWEDIVINTNPHQHNYNVHAPKHHYSTTSKLTIKRCGILRL
jgi:hypothetical protein